LHEREEEKDGFRLEGVEKQRVILLRLIEPHLVQVIPATEPFLLAPATSRTNGWPSTPSAAQPIEQSLKTVAGKIV
jgi:hypothetical protein